MGDYVINVLYNIMGELEIGAMMCGIFCVPITKKKLSLVLGSILLIVLCAGGDWEEYDDFFLLTLRQLLPLLIWILLASGGCLRNLAIYICSMMYLNLPYFCIDLLFSGFSVREVEIGEGDMAYLLMCSSFTIAGMGILGISLRKRITGYKEIVSNLPARYFVIGSVCASAASLVQNFVESISREYQDLRLSNIIAGCAIIVSIMFYTLGIVSVVLDIFRKRYKEESRLKEQYLQMSRNYVKTVRDNAKETRKIRHDIQNHMNILSYHLENGEYQKARTYLSEMQSHMEQAIKKTVSVNHELVDAVLSQAQSEMEGQKIRWEVEGTLPQGLPIGDFDICTIFSNLLSNSIEACMEVAKEQRYIHLEIRRLEDELVIETANSCNHLVDVAKLGSVTSKKDNKNHGYGILNMKDAIHKNHGELLFESTENKFVVRILFHL